MVYALAALLLLGACQKEDWSNQVASGKFLTLELNTAAKSRVPVVGDDRFNENEVKSVDVYFFHNGQENTATAVDAQIGLIPEGSLLQVELNENITDGDYYIYVVANIPENTPQASDNTLAELKERTITTVWKSGEDDADVIEPSFVMDGYTTVTVNSEGASGHVKLTRAMAKVMLYTSTEKELNINGMTYEPVPERMFVTMYNSVTKTNLADNYSVNADADYQAGIRRNYDSEYPEEVPAKEIDENADEDAPPYYRYEQMAPFYSYPNPETTAERKDAYLMLCVPWTVRQSGGDGSYQAVNYYYRVPITGNADLALMMRNQYYRINVHIGVLGSVNPEDAVEITNARFEIYDWFEVGIDTDMQQYQYLVLDEYESVMNNTDELIMPYISSSDLAWSDTEGIKEGEYTKIVSVSYPDYSQPFTTTTVLDTPAEIEEKGFSIEEGNEGELVFRHVIPDDVFVPYTITIQVYNKQGVPISEPWIIRQYPDIYIEADFNTEGQESRFVNGYWNAPYGKEGWFEDDDYDLNVYDDLGNSLNTILNIASESYHNDDNENQYTIYITSFEAGQNYVIGDPRTEEPQDITTRNGNKRFDDLIEYYPTREEGVESMLTPAYKVASSWGGASSMDYETAKARCAAYQENGYPAGRWRMPTEAEIDYIVELSANGDIPMLFLLSGSGQYWASSGRVCSGEGWEDSGSSTTAYIRCVYDVWYWGDEKISEHPEDERNGLTDTDFVWGDGGTLRRGNKKN